MNDSHVEWSGYDKLHHDVISVPTRCEKSHRHLECTRSPRILWIAKMKQRPAWTTLEWVPFQKLNNHVMLFRVDSESGIEMGGASVEFPAIDAV